MGSTAVLRSSKRLQKLRAWAEEFGGIVLLRPGVFGGRPILVLSEPTTVHALLQFDEQHAVKPSSYYYSIDELVHSKSKPVSSIATCPVASSVRKSLMYSFSERELRLDFEVTRAKALDLCAALRALGPGVVVDGVDASCRLSLDLVGLCKLGYDFEAVGSGGEVLMLQLLREVAQEWELRRRRPLRRLAPWWDDSAAAAGHKLHILQAFVEQELWPEIQGRGPPPADDCSVAAQLVRLSAAGGRGSLAVPALSQERVLAEIGALLLLGAEPLGLAIASALGCLAAHPAAQAKLMAELRREGVAAIVQDDVEALSIERLDRLPFLECVVREALRLHPPMACPATVRVTEKEVVVGPLTLPGGVEVAVDVAAMQRSPAMWRDADRFNPERWAATVQAAAAATAAGRQAGADGTDAELTVALRPATPYDGLLSPEGACCGAAIQPVMKQQQQQAGAGAVAAAAEAPACSPEAFMPFGAGARSCLGQRFAVVAVKVAVAVLAAHFEFELVGGVGATGGEDAAGLFLRPKDGLPLLLHPRPVALQ